MRKISGSLQFEGKRLIEGFNKTKVDVDLLTNNNKQPYLK